jgi:hypothetical protein
MEYGDAVLCHDMERDPCLVFVNETAQQLWGPARGDCVGHPSGIMAAPEHRAAHLDTAGLAAGYAGERVAADGS